MTILEVNNDLEGIFEETKASLDSLDLDIVTSEIRNTDNREIFYIEFLMPTYSENEERIISEAISICVLNNEKFAILNPYVNEAEKENIIQAMEIMVQTVKVK